MDWNAHWGCLRCLRSLAARTWPRAARHTTPKRWSICPPPPSTRPHPIQLATPQVDRRGHMSTRSSSTRWRSRRTASRMVGGTAARAAPPGESSNEWLAFKSERFPCRARAHRRMRKWRRTGREASVLTGMAVDTSTRMGAMARRGVSEGAREREASSTRRVPRRRTTPIPTARGRGGLATGTLTPITITTTVAMWRSATQRGTKRGEGTTPRGGITAQLRASSTRRVASSTSTAVITIGRRSGAAMAAATRAAAATGAAAATKMAATINTGRVEESAAKVPIRAASPRAEESAAEVSSRGARSGESMSYVQDE